MEISLNELIHRQNLKLAELVSQRENGDSNASIPGNIKQAEDRVDELNGRLERRRQELQQERHCTISDIQRHGCAWILPHPERAKPDFARLVTDDATERMAVDTVIAYERARGWEAVSVESENRGFDLISRRPHPEDPQTAIEVRFIEVKGRSAIGEIALTMNEYKTAQRLKKDYWLYVVFNCASKPEVNLVQDPAQLDWKPIVKIEHYLVRSQAILEVATT
jgi:HAMP domain-containing protein